MWQLIEEAGSRPLTDLEKTELQALFIRVAYNDVRALALTEKEYTNDADRNSGTMPL
jgi:hypothetical protein